MQTLSFELKVSRFLDATAIVIRNPLESMKRGTTWDFNRKLYQAGSNNRTYWIVKDENGNVVANTKLGIGREIMTKMGEFTPKKAGTYTVTAECYRSRTAKVLRAATSTTITVK